MNYLFYILCFKIIWMAVRVAARDGGKGRWGRCEKTKTLQFSLEWSSGGNGGCQVDLIGTPPERSGGVRAY